MVENLRARRATALMQLSTYLSQGVAPATRIATRHYEAKEISNEAILPHMVPQQRVECLLPPSRFKKERIADNCRVSRWLASVLLTGRLGRDVKAMSPSDQAYIKLKDVVWARKIEDHHPRSTTVQ